MPDVDMLRPSAQSQLKFQNLSAKLRRSILAGTWPVGAKLPTEQQMVADSGLSLTTVRRAYDELVREELVVRRRGAGTFVAPRQQRRSARGATVGVMIPETDLYFGRALQGIEDQLAASGAALQLTTSNYDIEREQTAIRSLQERGVDGLILVPLLSRDAARDRERVEELLGLPMPVVLMERRLAGAGARDATEHVVSDHEGGAFDAVRHLVTLGHTRVALAYRNDAYTGRGVRNGYRQACEALGFEPLEHEASALAWSASLADDVVADLMHREVTAALVFGDREATMVEAAASRAGLRVPEDLALVSYDDEVAELAEVPLTAMAPAKHRMGQLSAELLVRRIAEGSARCLHQVWLRPQLVVRESCGARQPGRV